MKNIHESLYIKRKRGSVINWRMRFEKLSIMGYSEPVLIMILDILESFNSFPKIEIVNNLGLNIKPSDINSKFDVELISEYNYYINNILV